MKNCALLTESGGPREGSDDRQVLKDLQSRIPELKFHLISWDENTDWKTFDFAIIRSTWDYIDRLPQFLDRLKEIESQGCQLFNSYETVQANSNKSYLLELQHLGIDLIPTATAGMSLARVSSILASWPCSEILIKPMVGAGASGIKIFKKKDFSTELSSNLARYPGYMIQPKLSEIEEGEVSAVFFNGKFSHSVIKKPKLGDFRVQEHHGGLITSIDLREEDLAFFKKVALHHSKLLYVRVDAIRLEGRWHLMEVELIEPSLYFKYCPEGIDRFATAIKEKLKI